MHGNKRYLKPCKKVQLTLKTPRLYSIYRCIEKKYFLWKRLGLDLIFTRQDFISCDLICRNFMAAPVLFQEKNIPGIKNSGLYFNWHFILWKLQKIGTFLPNVLFPYFQVFFKKLFSGDFFWPSPSVLFTVIILNNSILESRALFTAWKPENRNRVKNKI